MIYITNLLLAGADIKTVQYLAGLEKSKTTLDIYAHLTYNRPEDIIDKVNFAFQKKWTDTQGKEESGYGPPPPCIVWDAASAACLSHADTAWTSSPNAGS